MYCQNCGKQIADNTAVCPSCGTAVTRPRETQTPQIQNTQYPPYSQPDPNLPYSYYGGPMLPPYSGLCIAGFVLSFLMPLIGLIISIVGINDCSKTGKRGKGLAIAGTIISAVYMFVLIINVIILIIAFASGAIYL